MESIMNQISQAFAGSQGVFYGILALLMAVGLCLLVAGQRYFKRLLFLVGAVPTYVALHCCVVHVGWLQEWHAIAAGVFIGLAMIFMSWLFVYMFGFWTVIGCVGGIVGLAIDFAAAEKMTLVKLGWLLMCCGVAGGVIALIKQKHIVIVATSITGGVFLTFAAFAFAATGSIGAMLATCLVISGAGIFVQYKYTASKSFVKTDDSSVAVVKKSKAKYVLLALTFGYLGVHNFYAGRYCKGGIQLCLSAFAGWMYWVPVMLMQLWALGNILCASKNLQIKGKTDSEKAKT